MGGRSSCGPQPDPLSAVCSLCSAELFRCSLVPALTPYALHLHRMESAPLGVRQSILLLPAFPGATSPADLRDNASRFPCSPLPTLPSHSLEMLFAWTRPSGARLDAPAAPSGTISLESLYDDDEDDNGNSELEEEELGSSDSGTEDEDDVALERGSSVDGVRSASTAEYAAVRGRCSRSDAASSVSLSSDDSEDADDDDDFELDEEGDEDGVEDAQENDTDEDMDDEDEDEDVAAASGGTA